MPIRSHFEQGEIDLVDVGTEKCHVTHQEPVYNGHTSILLHDPQLRVNFILILDQRVVLQLGHHIGAVVIVVAVG